MKAQIDLHMHTVNSDGSLTPQELIEELNKNDIEIFAITDHNVVKAYNTDFKLNKNQKLIKGVEVNTTIDGESIELLCYGIDVDTASKLSYINVNKEETDYILFDKVKKQLEEQGFILTDAKYNGKGFVNDSIFRALLNNEENIIKVPKLKEIDASIFYRQFWTKKDSPFYVDTTSIYPSINTVIKDFKEMGSTIFLAHPYSYNRPEFILNEVVDKVDGIECGHSDCDIKNTIKLLDLCKAKGKLVSAGSDYHGTKSEVPYRKLGMYNLSGVIESEIYKWIFNYIKG